MNNMNNIETIILVAVILLALFFILPSVMNYSSPVVVTKEGFASNDSMMNNNADSYPMSQPISQHMSQSQQMTKPYQVSTENDMTRDGPADMMTYDGSIDNMIYYGPIDMDSRISSNGVDSYMGWPEPSMAPNRDNKLIFEQGNIQEETTYNGPKNSYSMNNEQIVAGYDCNDNNDTQYAMLDQRVDPRKMPTMGPETRKMRDLKDVYVPRKYSPLQVRPDNLSGYDPTDSQDGSLTPRGPNKNYESLIFDNVTRSIMSGSQFMENTGLVTPPWVAPAWNPDAYGPSSKGELNPEDYENDPRMLYNKCSLSCCSPQYPTPFQADADPFVCDKDGNNKYLASNYTCTNNTGGTGCLCMTPKQVDGMYDGFVDWNDWNDNIDNRRYNRKPNTKQ